jgi:hypothetical protein
MSETAGATETQEISNVPTYPLFKELWIHIEGVYMHSPQN